MAVKYSCFELETPSGKKISRIGDAYVDDTSLLKTSNSPATNDNAPLGTITKEMEEISQNFERKLYSTGGALNLKKCFLILNILTMGSKRQGDNGNNYPNTSGN